MKKRLSYALGPVCAALLIGFAMAGLADILMLIRDHGYPTIALSLSGGALLGWAHRNYFDSRLLAVGFASCTTALAACGWWVYITYVFSPI